MKRFGYLAGNRCSVIGGYARMDTQRNIMDLNARNCVLMYCRR